MPTATKSTRHVRKAALAAKAGTRLSPEQMDSLHSQLLDSANQKIKVAYATGGLQEDRETVRAELIAAGRKLSPAIGAADLSDLVDGVMLEAVQGFADSVGTGSDNADDINDEDFGEDGSF